MEKIYFKLTKILKENSFEPGYELEMVLVNEYDGTYKKFENARAITVYNQNYKEFAQLTKSLSDAKLIITNEELMFPLTKREETGDLIKDAASLLSTALQKLKNE